MKATSTKQFAPRKFGFTAEDLRHYRHVKRMGWIAISRLYGCHHTTVLYACRRLGVPTKLTLAVPREAA